MLIVVVAHNERIQTDVYRNNQILKYKNRTRIRRSVNKLFQTYNINTDSE